jgi:hypothetical protein
MPDSTWIIEMGAEGVRVRRKFDPPTESYFVSWRSIIGHVLIHKG